MTGSATRRANSSRAICQRSLRHRSRAVTVRLDVPVDVIDDGGVEVLLLLEERSDGGENEAPQPTPPAIAGHRARGQQLPSFIQPSDLRFVKCGRRCRELRSCRTARIQRRQRVVVGPIGLLALVAKAVDVGASCGIFGIRRGFGRQI